MKVLVVDDVGYIRHHVSRMLEGLGHVPLATDSARHAMQMLEKDPSIDVVLTDLLMAELDGLWLFKNAQTIVRMTDAGDARPPAFILMSALRAGSGVDRDVQKLQLAEQMGFVEVLAKPFDAKRLRIVLDNIERTKNPLPGATVLLDRLKQLTLAVHRIIDHHDDELNADADAYIEDATADLVKLEQFATSLV
ncbi:MAG TPA: response regulator [Planctomycetaceae bacterium]|nr:response regulator [Planctomycetaceae bacterium]